MDISVEKLLSELLLSPDCLPDFKSYLRKHYKSSQIQTPESLNWLLSIMSWTCWQYFIQALDDPVQLSPKDIALGEYQILTETGAAQLKKESLDKNFSYNLIVPNQIKQLLPEFDFDAMKVNKERMSLIHLYAAAAVNVYGIIDSDIFLRMFNGYMNEPSGSVEQVFEGARSQLNMNELRSILEPYSKASIDVLLTGDKLVHPMIGSSNMDRSVRERIDRYCPFKKSDFLKYANKTYYEETPQVREFKDTLAKKTQGIYQEYLDTICLVFAPCYLADWEEIIEVGLMELPEVRSKTNKELFAKLFVRAKNSLPNWTYKGWSKDDIIETGELTSICIEDDIQKFMKIQ